MASSIVRGMPYATMQYSLTPKLPVVPTLSSEIDLSDGPIIADGGNTTFHCHDDTSRHVHRELLLSFRQSDFTWVVFFSETVIVECHDNGRRITFKTARQPRPHESDRDLIVRVALADSCTTGANPLYCQHGMNVARTEAHIETLRRHTPVYPGLDSNVRYTFDDDMTKANLILDFDAHVFPDWQRFYSAKYLRNHLDPPQLIGYGLPHHTDKLEHDPESCTQTLVGPACLVTGEEWYIAEELPPISFWAPRTPDPKYIPTLAEALSDDLEEEMPEYYRRGTGDTYFSGNLLSQVWVSPLK